jgi:hypothetical protein
MERFRGFVRAAGVRREREKVSALRGEREEEEAGEGGWRGRGTERGVRPTRREYMLGFQANASRRRDQLPVPSLKLRPRAIMGLFPLIEVDKYFHFFYSKYSCVSIQKFCFPARVECPLKNTSQPLSFFTCKNRTKRIGAISMSSILRRKY